MPKQKKNLPVSSKKPTRPAIDWISIEKDYRTAQISNVENGKKHGVSEGMIRKRAKKYGWKKDLAEIVKKQVREKLVRDEVRDSNAETTDQEIVDAASNRGAEVIKIHRKDVQRSQSLVRLFQSQLDDAAQNRDELETQIEAETTGQDGKVNYKRRSSLLKAVSLPAHAGILRDLTIAQKNLIGLERQSYNLDDKTPLDDLIEKIQVEFV